MQNIGIPEELFKIIEEEQEKFKAATGGEKPKWKIVDEWREKAESETPK